MVKLTLVALALSQYVLVLGLMTTYGRALETRWVLLSILPRWLLQFLVDAVFLEMVRLQALDFRCTRPCSIRSWWCTIFYFECIWSRKSVQFIERCRCSCYRSLKIWWIIRMPCHFIVLWFRSCFQVSTSRRSLLRCANCVIYLYRWLVLICESLHLNRIYLSLWYIIRSRGR